MQNLFIIAFIAIGLLSDVQAIEYYAECKTDTLGNEYQGKLSVTRSGKTCQRWNRQSPHEHSRNDTSTFPDDNLKDANNYCRNPDNEPEGLWCYTTDSNTRWEYCNVQQCECKTATLGKAYQGKISSTRSGKTCQRWDSQSPHGHGNNNDPSKFPDDNLKDANNYCRNPDNEPEGPWCYTTDSNTRWEYCNVKQCGQCGGTLSGTGEFSSTCVGNVEHNYPNGANCLWTINAESGSSVKLIFNIFHLEGGSDCKYDYVEVYGDQRLVGRYCGKTPPPTLTSTVSFGKVSTHHSLARDD
ncbi:unnamed protein product [Owenia fusiformis]|uniref:Plasminogen n=1 Tax=Owenia fusiformis TaxID=6347 RepID=A0A8S4Q550_OWEFU|nr:unnamed protein product [Owenia fusiformis]